MRTRFLAASRRCLLACCLAAGLVPAAWAQDMAFSQAHLVRGLLPSVVNITARAEVTDTPDPVLASSSGKASQSNSIYAVKTSAGSGFVIDPSGEIATNWHVVAGAFEIYVTFADGTRAKAELLNASPLVDLAVISVNTGHKLAAVKWADSAKVQVGDPVLAIGNPLGVGMSVSGGLVSALNRNIMDTPYDDFIQTDAAINHGNSGGPLFDMTGAVIGVNSAIISPTSGSAGLGFAMPSNDAKFIFEHLTHKEFARPGFLGAKLQPVTPEMAQALGLDDARGSIVATVIDGGPAASAGLRPGDVILRYGDDTPSDERALYRAIARTTPGTTVPLGIRRQGHELAIPVKIEQWPTMWWEDVKAAAAARPHLSIPPDLGLTVEPLTDQARETYDVRPQESGLIVTGVLPGTDAAQRGFSTGDVIEQVGDAMPKSAAELQEAIDKARTANAGYLLVLVMRKHQMVTPAQLPGPKWLTLRLSTG
jgi:serine protease Do